jgi:phosphoribosyl 1,2-cyclic phosphate phosphodiesterase
LRQQLLANDIDKVDGVFWTHDHADHCHGIDDLRPMRFSRNAPLPGFASDTTARSLRQRFSYVFSGRYGYPTIVQLETLEVVKLHAGFAIGSVEMPHGPTQTTGFRFDADGKSICYATDFSAISDEMVALFADTDILVTDCLRREPHPTHASLAMAIELAQRTGAVTTVLTHLDMSMDYAVLSAEVPDGMLVGYDGMELTA